MGKQPKDEGHSQSNNAPEHSGSRKNETKHTDQAQKAQNRANSGTLQNWHNCQTESSTRTGLARLIHWQHARMGATIRLISVPVEFTMEK